MTPQGLIADLTTRNKAYQVLYALGRNGGDMRFRPETLTSEEAVCLVEIVRNMDGTTYLEILLERCWGNITQAMKEYITQ